MSSLLDSLKEEISPDLIRGLASNSSEPGDSVQKALLASGTAMLATLASKAQDSGFLNQIMNLISNFRTGSAMGAAAGGGSSTVAGAPQAGTTLLNMLFGNNVSSVQSKIAEFSGIRASSAESIMASAAPLVLGTLTSKVSSLGLTATGLCNLLASELPSLRSYLPSGFSIPGVSGVTAHASQMAEGARTVNTPKWLWPVVLAVLLIGALLWFANRNSSTVNDAANTAADKASNAASQASTAASNAAAPLGASVRASVPGGVLNIPENGMESKLLVFIRDPNAQPSRETWFEFDRLTFDTGGNHLQLSSQEQLENIAKILRAYPNVHALVGAYTDTQGDSAANLKLSQDRANVVMAQLVALGVDSARLDAKGYGAEHPVGDNSTLDGRAANRRIALRVTQK
jgi:outer membrane protein OmpA-like peptidoglycan-associated protein